MTPAILAKSDAWDITTVTRWVNGGLGGLAARVFACNRALAALGAVPVVPDRLSQVCADVVTNPAPESDADKLNAAVLESLHKGA